MRRVGATLPEDIDHLKRFNGIKCMVSGVRCLIDIRRVTEVIEERAVTPVPGTVLWVEGIMNFRGTLVPVYNSHRFLMPIDTADRHIAGQDGPLLVLKYGNELCAVRINQVLGMQKCMDDDFYQNKHPAASSESINSYIDASIGIDERIWGKIDITRLLDVITRENSRLQQQEATVSV